MKRYILKQLEQWQGSEERKPLILRGARQVGKTWLMKEFGALNYDNVVYVNFERQVVMRDLFLQDFDVNRILIALRIQTDEDISPGRTLIILDEIQEAQGGITSLKYFCEDAPEYHVIAAGSLLGVALHQHISFPVGKVDFLDMYPMNFTEFLMALDEQPLLDLLHSRDWALIKTFRTRYISLLRQYYFVGGMPEAVKHFRDNKDYTHIRKVQKSILRSYELDFSKHAPTDIVPRIRMLWNAVLPQLAKENKKFIYGAVKSGARAKDYELALAWLVDSGLVYKVCRASKGAIPLKAYEEFSIFKLFIADVGLLGAIGNLNKKTLLEGNRIFEEFKGALTEQYVLQQIIAERNSSVYYWSHHKSTAEIDFLLQFEGDVVPVEVKAEENLQSKSLKYFHLKYPATLPVRLSMSDYRQQDCLTNFPLYAIPEMFDELESRELNLTRVL